MISPIKETTITNFIDFLSAISAISAIDDKNAELFFRGQEEDWPLLPRIARNVKLPGGSIVNLEEKIFAEFTRRARPFFSFEPEMRDDIELLTIGQHYGLPTRLLDWTTNPLAALWFAIYKRSNISTSDSVVWAYRYMQSNNAYQTGYAEHVFETPNTQYFKPIHIDQRLISQRSVFTMHGSGETGAAPKFTPLQVEIPDALHKLIIPAGASQELLRKLEICGIDESSMFPGLDGLCRQISSKFSL